MAEIVAASAGPLNTGPTFGITKFLDPLQVPPVHRARSHRGSAEMAVRAVRTRVRLHSELPDTAVFAYEGRFPGPTIEVRRGERLRVEWANDIEGTMPLVAIRTPFQPEAPPEEVSSNNPGYPRNPDGTPADGAAIIKGVSEVPGWLVTHLHGAEVAGGSDGWAHNASLRGNSQLAEYLNRQRATALWYHDHAMAITRWNVHAGLLGLYLVRDDEEDELGLPARDFEVPLIIGDRNLDVDDQGAPTGQLLFKVDYTGTALLPFRGPFTLVNGTIWPHLEVEARWYRFRLLNTSNARFYRLVLVDEDGGSKDDAVRQIGTDGGLLPAPVPLPGNGLVLAPAERADLLIDFGRPELRGRRLRLTNTAEDAPLEPDLMEFRVEDRRRRDGFVLPGNLAAPRAETRHLPGEHAQVWIGLVPPGTAGNAHPQMWDLRELTDPGEIPDDLPVEGILQLIDPETGRARTFQRAASLFDDTVSVFLEQNHEVAWNFVSFGAPPHPMHIHLVQFLVSFRRGFTPDFDLGVGGTRTPARDFADIPLEGCELGWKDVITVNAGEWVRIVGRFGESTGEYVFHCHILDHEDEGMMRPFVVHPAEIARFHPRRGRHGERAPSRYLPSPWRDFRHGGESTGSALRRA